MIEPKSPTETVARAMEEVENAEHVLIIYTNKDGSISWFSNTDKFHVKLGMTEFVSTCIKDNISQARNELT